MKKIIRLTERELNNIIKNVISEQDEDQYMTDQNPEQMAGGLNDEPGEGEETNFDEFVQCAQALISKGVTIGELVDKLLETEEGSEDETEPEAETEPTPGTEIGKSTDSGLAAESKVSKKNPVK